MIHNSNWKEIKETSKIKFAEKNNDATKMCKQP